MANTRWWSVRWKRVGLTLALILIVPLVAVATFRLEFRFLEPDIRYLLYQNEIRQIIKDSPVVGLVPQPIRDAAAAEFKNGLRMCQFGYCVQVPRTEAVLSKDFKTIRIRNFEDGLSVALFDPTDHIDMLRAPAGDEATLKDGLRPLLGDQAVRSHYDYAVAEMNALPTDISFFHSRKSVARAGMLLIMKSFDVPSDSTVIYYVGSTHVKGFQFGDPQKVPTFVKLLVFDDQDRPLEMVFKGPKGNTQAVLSQAQINSIIASIHPTD